jgi:hypothetical protein
VRVSRPRTRAPARRWRRRGRRAQVAAVATILGLLLVVTFIANYLTTQLPNQMSVNDLNHDILVENQLGRLQAQLTAVAQSGPAGASVSQPITLGSDASPPFAASDSSVISSGNLSGGFKVNFTLAGPASYSPPAGGPQGGPYNAANDPTCVPIPPSQPTNSITCSGSSTIIYNFTGTLANQPSYSLTLSGGGVVRVNIISNHSSISITGSSNPGITLLVLGSNDTISVVTSSVPENIVIVGNYDTLSFTGSSSGPERVLIVGNHDTVSNVASSTTEVASIYGSNDSFNPGTVSSSHFAVFFNGFNPLTPSATCPVDNISQSDTVVAPVGSGSTFAVTYNNTVYSGTGTVSGTGGSWAVTYQIPTPFACPFFSQVAIPVPSGGSPPGASLVVHLRNTYAPAAEIAFDQGAVVYAQPGGIPLLIDGPSFSYSGSAVSLMVPVFQGPIPSESGVGTADVMFRLLTTSTFQFPVSGFSLQTGSHVTLSLRTPYGAAWMAYFGSNSNLAGLVSCQGVGTACSGYYQPVGPLATITLSLPATSLNLEVAVFSVSVT